MPGLMYYKPLDGSDPIPIAKGAKGEKGDPGTPGVTKEYVDQQDALKVSKAGDTMTGPLIVPTPTAAAHAATKGYVDGIAPNTAVYHIGNVVTDGAGQLTVNVPAGVFSEEFNVLLQGYGANVYSYISFGGNATSCVLQVNYSVGDSAAAGVNVKVTAIGPRA